MVQFNRESEKQQKPTEQDMRDMETLIKDLIYLCSTGSLQEAMALSVQILEGKTAVLLFNFETRFWDIYGNKTEL